MTSEELESWVLAHQAEVVEAREVLGFPGVQGKSVGVGRRGHGLCRRTSSLGGQGAGRRAFPTHHRLEQGAANGPAWRVDRLRLRHLPRQDR